MKGRAGGCYDSGPRWRQSRRTVRAAVTDEFMTGGIYTAPGFGVFILFEANTVLFPSLTNRQMLFPREKGKKPHVFPLESIKIICGVTSVPWTCSVIPSLMSISRAVPLVLPEQGDHSICLPLPLRCCTRSAETAAGTVEKREFDKEVALAHAVMTFKR